MKYFITGGSGFIGRNLVLSLLKRNVEVTVIDIKKFPFSIKNKKFKFIKGNILNKKLLLNSMKNSDTVIHLAANSKISEGFKNPMLDIKTGIYGTVNVLESLRLLKINNLIYTSGSGVYGNQTRGKLKENFAPLNPVSTYGSTKLASENLMSSYSYFYDLNISILRPCNIVGSNMTHGVIFDLVKKLKKKKTYINVLGNGEQIKPYIDVIDLISAIKILLKKKLKGYNYFNIANDNLVSVKYIAEQIIKNSKYKSANLFYANSRSGWKGDVYKYSLNNQKLRKLGWKPKLSAKETINRAILTSLKENDLI